MIRGPLVAAVLALGTPAMAETSPPARVYAAGSLRAVLAQVAVAFKSTGGGAVDFEFGPSGILHDRLAAGERADVFASANMEHPRKLAAAGKAGPVRRFARNRLCALVPAAAGVTTENLLERMLDPKLKLGTSTPRADPSGDYAWLVFERAEELKPGAFEALSKKALQLVGGPVSPTPPPNRTLYSMLVANGEADIFLTYCTNTLQAQREEPSLATIALPESLAVGADYGVTILNGATHAGISFEKFLLGAEAQWILATAGFSPAADVSGR